MIKILIVDDERRICRLINRLIDYKRFGLSLAGCAYDGTSALELIRQEKPQIVITDIKMPGMDGLELIKKTRELGLDAHFIILSGYGTFDYARSAIRYQVDDYLLKPVNEAVLNETLEKLCGVIAAQDARRGKAQVMEEELESAAQRMRSYFISSLIYNPAELQGKSIETLNEEYSLSFQPGLFRVAILNLIPREQEARITAIVRQVDQLFRLAMTERCLDCKSMIDKERIILVLNYKRELGPRMNGMLEYAFNNLAMNQEISSFVQMILIMGDVTDSPAGLYDSFRSADRSMNLGILRGYNACYTAAPGGHHNLVPDEEERAAMLRAIEAASKQPLIDLVADMTRRRLPALLENPAEMDSVIHIMGAYAEYAAAQDVRSDAFAEIRNQALYHYRVCSCLEEVEKLVADGIWKMKEIYEEIRAGKQSLPVVKAKQFIDKNYEKPISLESVAKEVYLSPAYFSAVFKKEVGVNFSDYLAQVRIERAKRLLTNIKYSVAEVAAAVGYPDQRYFSRVFKKLTGVNPLEYRKLQSYGLPEET